MCMRPYVCMYVWVCCVCGDFELQMRKWRVNDEFISPTASHCNVVKDFVLHEFFAFAHFRNALIFSRQQFVDTLESLDFFFFFLICFYFIYFNIFILHHSHLIRSLMHLQWHAWVPTFLFLLLLLLLCIKMYVLHRNIVAGMACRCVA